MRQKYEFTEDDLELLSSAADSCGVLAKITKDVRGKYSNGWTQSGTAETWLAAGRAFKAATGQHVTLDLEDPSKMLDASLPEIDMVLTPDYVSTGVVERVAEVVERVRANDGWLPGPIRNQLGIGALRVSQGVNDLPAFRTLVLGLSEIPREGGWDLVRTNAITGVQYEFSPRIRDGLGHGVRTATQSARTAAAALTRRGEAPTRRPKRQPK